MAYGKYYPEGWKDNEEGGTPITAAALNNMETGISAAHEFMARKDNPHGVTKSQVGLGNVPNLATNNQTPTYTVVGTLSSLVSGEKLSAAFGKLAKAVTDLISHLADNVRHITAAERTAWNAKTTTAVKGNAETSYRTGNVNLTPENIGAATDTALQEAIKDADYRFQELTFAVGINIIHTTQLDRILMEERHRVTLENTLAFPFNSTVNSPATIALDKVRDNAEYSVEAEVLSHDGPVGEIEVTGKARNGFKISYSGSGSSVELLVKVKGGMS